MEGGGESLAWALSSGCWAPAHGASLAEHLEGGGEGGIGCPSVARGAFLHLPLIWIRGPCGHTYLHGLVRRQEWSGTERKQLVTRVCAPEANPVSVLPLWGTRLLRADCGSCVLHPNHSKALINIAREFARETVWGTTFLYPFVRRPDWREFIASSAVCPKVSPYF